MSTDDLRARMTEAAKDAFADEVRPDGMRLFTDERQRHPWRALDDALAAAWNVISPQLQTPVGADIVPAGPAIARALRRARRRRRVEIWRYRLAVHIGGWVLREEVTELDRLRADVRALIEAWDARATRYLAWRDHHHENGDETTARISRVRADMCQRHAAQLRQLLEVL